MRYSGRLFRWRDPYDLADTQQLFVAAYQAAHSPDYSRILQSRGLDLAAGQLSQLLRSSCQGIFIDSDDISIVLKF